MRSNEEFKATVRRRCADLRQKRQRKRRLLALVMPAMACLAAVCLLLPSLLNHWPPSSGIGSECAESVYESAALSKEYMEIETEGTRRRITASAAIDVVRSLLEELILSGGGNTLIPEPVEKEYAISFSTGEGDTLRYDFQDNGFLGTGGRWIRLTAAQSAELESLLEEMLIS